MQINLRRNLSISFESFASQRSRHRSAIPKSGRHVARLRLGLGADMLGLASVRWLQNVRRNAQCACCLSTLEGQWPELDGGACGKNVLEAGPGELSAGGG